MLMAIGKRDASCSSGEPHRGGIEISLRVLIEPSRCPSVVFAFTEKPVDDPRMDSVQGSFDDF